MYSNEKSDGQCYYCGNEWKRYMKPVCENEYAIVYMAGYQKFYPGRCIVALKNHKEELYEMSKEEQAGFFDAVAQISKAISRVFPCHKLNYAVCGDTNRHFHMHIVPKIKEGPAWGQLFEMLPPENERILIEEEQLNNLITSLAGALS